MFLLKVLLFFALTLSAFSTGYAQASDDSKDVIRFTSDTQQTVMVELYTSQGSSSCPQSEK